MAGEKGEGRIWTARSLLKKSCDGGIDSDPRIGLTKMINYLCGLLSAEGSERRKQGCFKSSRRSNVFNLDASH